MSLVTQEGKELYSPRQPLVDEAYFSAIVPAVARYIAGQSDIRYQLPMPAYEKLIDLYNPDVKKYIPQKENSVDTVIESIIPQEQLFKQVA